MFKKIISLESPLNKGVIIVRVITGIIIATFGLEVFETDKIDGYEQWLTDLGFPLPRTMAYFGKGTEFAGGILLALGLFTRLVTIPLIVTMIVITFIMGDGNFRSDSFLLLLLFAAFFFIGSGKWSLDYLLLSGKANRI